MAHAAETPRLSGVTTFLFGALAWLALDVPAAFAGCSDRPGTPNEIRAVALSPTEIEFSWKNTTARASRGTGSTHSMYFDISVRDGRGEQINRDRTGWGPLHGLQYGMRSSTTFTGLSPGATLCAKIRARTAGGTQGCVSAIWSATECATTSLQATTAKPVRDTAAAAPSISVENTAGAANGFIVRCSNLTPRSAMTIRVADAALQWAMITTIGNHRLAADSAGRCQVTLTGLCQRAGKLHFSVTDGRRNTRDLTGTLWSNTVTTTCQ